VQSLLIVNNRCSCKILMIVWGAAMVPAIGLQSEFFRVVEQRSSMLPAAPRKGWRVGANLHCSCPCKEISPLPEASLRRFSYNTLRFW